MLRRKHQRQERLVRGFKRPDPIKTGIVGKPCKRRHLAEIMNQQARVKSHRSPGDSNHYESSRLGPEPTGRHSSILQKNISKFHRSPLPTKASLTECLENSQRPWSDLLAITLDRT